MGGRSGRRIRLDGIVKGAYNYPCKLITFRGFSVMSRVIYKYPLPLAAESTIDMPSGAQIIACQMQYDQPTLWALVDSEDTLLTPRHFAAVGTGGGHPMLDSNRATYLGTCQLQGGALVLHIFQVPEA